ncbi:PD-(D/E)XK nuclease-like domain-containing protein [Brucella haematophila]|uniref:PD-(D/E)XK nuclease-like domain-containing protein n=1 Tax=Brucella haematophila TaxID=419474 RepID=UPI00110DABA1|nr:PD-(D/E)XK nuclease-like domain-containing protein [Brucella haematophila]TMU84699.1 hypothetical protein FGI60_26000 [Brucella haematophila]
MTDTLHEDGVYFGMSDEEYHADPALGSTGLKKLIGNAPDFWWDSPMNPARDDDDDTPAKIFGRQLHMCVLEGVEKFKAHHEPLPEPSDFPGCVVTSDELRAYLKKKSAAISGTKDKLIDRALRYDDCPIIFDRILERAKNSDKTLIKFKDYSKILAASAFIKANKTLAKAFEGGQPEVSVFWTVNGIRFKARIDYLQINSNVDLKSIANRSGKEFNRACRDAMATYDYIVSAGHYSDGRRQMKGLFRAGKVFGLPEGQEDWLSKVVSNPVFAFVFVFWQKEGAPISHGIMLSPGNPLFDRAAERIAQAVENYRLFMGEFGTDTAWVPSTPLEELSETDMPVWYQQRLIGA